MNRKGISPIIAVLLLVIIAVAAAILTYLWVLGYIGTVQQQGGTEALQERIKIEGVSYDSGTNTLTIFVRNIGDVRTTISSAYLINVTGTVIGQNLELSIDLEPGQITESTGTNAVTITNATLNPGITYVVKVVTKTGAEATYTFTYRE